MEIVFWWSVLLLIYPYSIYPLCMIAISRIISKPKIVEPGYLPNVTVVIPAYNEAQVIEATIRNKLEQDYPQEKLHIIVVSDGSTDATDSIVEKFSRGKVELVRLEGRRGKAVGLNAAVSHAKGQIIVFSDANSIFDVSAITHMVETLANPSIGYVTGQQRLLASGEQTIHDGVSIYSRYESALRSAESRAGSIIGVNGGIGAMKKELYRNVPESLISDFVLPLSVISEGKRVVFDPRAKSTEIANSELTAEFAMRIRVTLRALQAISFMRRLLNPLVYPLVAFQIMSHKVLRYMGFAFLCLAILSSCVLAVDNLVFRTVLAIEIFGIALALAGLSRLLPEYLSKLTRAPAYLLLSYLAFAVATYKFFRGDRVATWRPRSGN